MNTIFSPAMESNNAVANGPKVGDILVSCAGYEACIAHWAKVVDVTKASVKLELLGTIDTPTSPMTWDSLPNVDSSGGTIVTKRFKPHGDSYKVKDTSYSTYYVWSGEPINCYNYH